MVGLYDQLIKKLCSKDSPVKIAVSSATISNAAEQTSKLYGGRNMQIIPPPEKDWGESFFMQTNYDKSVSRKYVGLFMGSRSPVVGSIEAASAILQGVSINRDQTKVSEKSEDPYRTLIWYFNSIRELAYSLSSRWDMESRIKLIRNVFDKQLESFSRSFRFPRLLELTSRRKSYEIKNVKAAMDVKYKHNPENGSQRSADLVFSTNMISVGIDIQRLGLMLVNGLPKTTAEYIQASSRVGREFMDWFILHTMLISLEIDLIMNIFVLCMRAYIDMLSQLL